MSEMIRDYPFTVERAAEPGDGLTLEGYAAVFNAPATITERGRTFSEVVARGAFKRSVNAKRPALMFNHGRHPLIGDMPLGVITEAREDDHGLFVSARLSDNWLIQPVRDAIADGAVTGMSFRFESIRDKWSADRSHRTLLELRVPELGPVGMPAYEATTVGVRSRADEALELLRDPEVLHSVLILAERADDEDPALSPEPAATGTSETDPPATTEPPPAASENTRRERLTAVAKLKGIIE